MSTSSAKALPLQGGKTDPSHDERLRLGQIDTAVSRPVAWAMVAFFLVIIAGVPIGQAILEKVKDDDSSLVDLFRHLPTKEHLRQFEKSLEDASYLKEFTQQRVQLWLTHYGRVGNKNAVIGHDGWLFYKPGITYLSGPAFLDPDIIETRERAALDSGDEPLRADPIVAIQAFSDALRARGIQLVLFPVPDKAMIQPRELSGRGSPASVAEVARASSWSAFAERVRALGVVLFDPTPTSLSPQEPPRYLVQDTHWTPEWMEGVAANLVKTIAPYAPKTANTEKPVYHAVPMEVSRVGDIVGMLKLPEGQNVFLPSTVTVHQVRNESDEPWEPEPSGDVLLLGDSFTNIFTAEPMGWGAAAGLGAQLALLLNRGVDVIAQNDAGAFATRQTLARELAAGSERLAGKRVVIWEFASRELGVGDWKAIAWPSGPQASREGSR